MDVESMKQKEVAAEPAAENTQEVTAEKHVGDGVMQTVEEPAATVPVSESVTPKDLPEESPVVVEKEALQDKSAEEVPSVKEDLPMETVEEQISKETAPEENIKEPVKEDFPKETVTMEEPLKAAESVASEEKASVVNQSPPIDEKSTEKESESMEVAESVTPQQSDVAEKPQKETSNKVDVVEKSQEDTPPSDAVEMVTEPVASYDAMDTSAEAQSASSPPSNADSSADTATNKNVPSSGLGLLAQYDSDVESDNGDDIVEVPVTAVTKYRQRVIEVNSDSSSDDSSSDSDVEYLNEIRKVIDKRLGSDDDDDEDEDGEGKKKTSRPLKVKGEQTLDDLPPIHELQITVPEEECVELGKIHSVVDQLVLVSVLPNSLLLDLDTVLFLDKGRRVLGEVFDVLGQVADPLYCVRFNSNAHVKEKGIEVGDLVYVAPKTQYTQFVILSNLMKVRGSDASWEHDVEPPLRCLDYSDDEEEREARAALRNKNRPNEKDDEPTKRSRNDSNGPATPRPQHQGQRGGRGGPPGGGQGYQRQRPPGGYPPNPNRGSWHSNYYPQPPHNQGYPGGGYHHGPPPPAPHHHPYAQAPPYQMPPQYPQQPYHQPPAASSSSSYTYQGLPQFEGRYPYGRSPQATPPAPNGPPPSGSAMYVPNPYAIRPPVMPPTYPPSHHQMPPE